MSKINDQPKNKEVLDQTELDEVSGGEDGAYEAPEATKVEYDVADRDNGSKCKTYESYKYDWDPRCYK